MNSVSGVITINKLNATPGDYQLRIRIFECKGNAGETLLNFTIPDPCPTVLGPGVIPAGSVGQNYSVSFNVLNGTGPYSYSLLSGALPPNVMLATDGKLSGTPTSAGTFNFTVKATNALGCAVQGSYALVINATCLVVNLGPAILPTLVVGHSFNQNLSASGGTAPYSFVVTGGILPAGLNLNA